MYICIAASWNLEWIVFSSHRMPLCNMFVSIYFLLHELCMICDTSLRVIFKCELMNSDIMVDMWVKWMKTSNPICRSQRWKRGAATWRFKLVRTASTFLLHSFCSKLTNQIRLQEERRSTQTSALLSSPPLPSHKSPVILPALDVWDTDVAFFQCWPRSIVVSCACGNHIFPLGVRN